MQFERHKLTIVVLYEEHCSIRELGIGINSQYVSGELDKSLEISSIVTLGKKEMLDGVKRDGK
jgi:hypothetical protein